MADSGDSSPHSAADDALLHHHHHHPDATTTNNSSPESAAAAAQTVAPAAAVPPPVPAVPAKVRLMVSYGGRIQPRPHDNQLSYVNGDTKILSIDRPLRFPDFAARLAGLAGARGDLCVKYQLPGEDLDALVSVTNDEDLEHLVIEYDRLHLFRAPAPAPGSGGSSRGGSTPRLRVFLFPVAPRPASPPKQPPPQQLELQREWYLDLKSASPPPAPQQALPPPPPLQMQNQQMQPPQLMMKQEAVPVQSPPPAAPMAVPQSVMAATKTGPDYLFGFDYGFMPPPAVKVKDPAGDPPKMRDNVPVEIPTKNEDRHPNPAADNSNNNNAMVSPAVSPAEFPRQIPDLEKLQLADNNATQQQQQPPPPAPAPAPAPQAAPAPAPVVAPAATVPAPLSRNGSDDSLTRAYPPATATPTAAAEYYVTKFPEKPPVPPPSSAPPAAAFLPVPGRYGSVAPGSGADPGPFFFIPAPPHGYYTSANPGGTSYYAVPHNNGNANGNGTAPPPAVSSAQGYPQVAYDSNGRAVYYTGLLPQYPSAVNGGGGMSASSAVLGTEPSKPVAVKPTVS